MWTLGNGGVLTPQTVTLEWGEGSGDTKVTDSSMSTAPAYISRKPPFMSSASLWHKVNDGTVMCRLSYPIGSVIDLVIDAVALDAGGLTYVSAAGGLSAGVLYAKYLDGVMNTTAGTDFVPVGYLSVVD